VQLHVAPSDGSISVRLAGQIVHELIEEARQIIAQRLLGLVQPV
jgi:hypothetical protein